MFNAQRCLVAKSLEEAYVAGPAFRSLPVIGEQIAMGLLKKNGQTIVSHRKARRFV